MVNMNVFPHKNKEELSDGDLVISDKGLGMVCTYNFTYVLILSTGAIIEIGKCMGLKKWYGKVELEQKI